MTTTKTKTTSFEPFVSRLICEYITYPAHVEINAAASVVKSEPTITVCLKVHGADRGKVIGKDGQNFKALLDLIQAAAERFDCEGALEVLNSSVGKRVEPSPAVTSSTWNNWGSIAKGLELAVLFITGSEKVGVKYEIEKEDSEDVGMFSITCEKVIDFKVETALATLVRAMGKQQGFPLRVKVRRE